MTAPLTHTFRCPAKVNLALSVGSPRADGFHPIASWMVAIDVCDDLTIAPLGDDQPSAFGIDWAAGAPRPSAIDWPLEADLMVRAHGLIEKHIGRTLPVKAELAKRIPVGAGLAGGSSNGAMMLKALDRVFELQLSKSELIDLSMQLGSDLAFFFSGGSAIVGGRGEKIKDAPRSAAIHLVLILPNFGCPTGAVYRAFDELKPEATVDEQAVRELARSATVTADGPFNDLASPAEVVQPQLRALRGRCRDIAGRTVHVTGSGAGMFAIASDGDEASRLADRIASQISDVAVLATKTIGLT